MVKLDRITIAWAEVLSRVSQGSVLGQNLFLINVNELLELIKISIKLFADDSKVWHKITSENDIHILQQDLTELEKWSATSLLKFNTSICKVMHIEHKGETKYFLHDPLNKWYRKT